MDKYIEYNTSDSCTGLNLLCDPRKMKREQKTPNKSNPPVTPDIKFIDKTYLDSFKQFIKEKIETFSPTKKKDNFDTLLISLWHQYIFNTIDEDKYYDFVKLLNKDYV